MLNLSTVVACFAQRIAPLPAFLAFGLALAVPDASVQAQPPSPPTPAAAIPVSIEQRLASELIRGALDAASVTPLTSNALDLACLLAGEAVALQPDSVGLWRITLGIATLAEREDLRAQAIERLSVLDPADEHIRLQKINLALDRFQTVEERTTVYERLLQEENIAKLGAPAASRLAFDYALLKQRLGDIEGFSRWLTKSLELDRANRSAAAMAAGFFQANVNDAVGRAELLVNLIMADPTDVQTQVTLAQHLLDNGAYDASKRIYELARNGMKASRMPATTDLMADIAIAQWAAGDIEGSLMTIDQRQADIDEVYRYEQARAKPDLTMTQIGELSGPLDPTLAAVTAAIFAGRRDASAADSLQKAIAAAQDQITRDSATNPPSPPEDLASQHLQVAWLALWLGDDQAKAAEHIAAAEALQPLSDAAKARFDGWKAFKGGEFARAIELFTPLSKDDAAATVGLALALERDGRARDAAARLLELNRSQPGSMIGIWSAQQLTRILGQRVSLSKQAAELEKLISSIPRTFDRYPRDTSSAVTLRLVPANPNPGAFDPLTATIELTNNTSIPLGIDPAGPLRPQVLVIPVINSASPLVLEPKPFIIDLDARLRLMPRETVRANIDLRWYSVGGLINRIASMGGLVKLTLDTNFMAAGDGSVIPGLYGVEYEAPLIRADGAPKDSNWVQEAIAVLDDLSTPQDKLMILVALVSSELQLSTIAPPADAAQFEVLRQANASLSAAFARLDAMRQAWSLMVMDRPAPGTAILDIARKSDSRLVQLAYLIAHADIPDDPMIDAGKRGEDPAIRRLADILAAGRKPLPAPTTSAPATAPASGTP